MLLFLACACIKEQTEPQTVPEGMPTDMVIPFGATNSSGLTIGTRTTLGEDKESKIWNIYVFIFDSDGRKFYGKFFDESTLNEESATDWWTVDNSTATGTLHIHTASHNGCRLYGIANIDADMVNISPELLATVQNRNDLLAMSATLNQPITSRSGYFPMSGTIVNTNNNDAEATINTGQSVPGSSLKLKLVRLDAKITFRIRVASPNEDVDGNVLTDPAQIAANGCKISNFIPGKWKVVNLPKKSYVIEKGAYKQNARGTGANAPIDAASLTSDFFDTLPTNFDSAERQTNWNGRQTTYSGTDKDEILIHPFSFYMMENRRLATTTPSGGWSYQARDKQDTIAMGAGQYARGDFLYAPEYSTYVVFTGRIENDNFTYGTYDGATLNAEPTYMVHLGDFSGSYGSSGINNFDIFRNHAYTYNIVIFDSQNIRTEVENNYDENVSDKTAEEEPGAKGKVTVSLEKIFTGDAHYCSHVITFHANTIKADNVTWYVKTPFNPNGNIPLRVSDENGEEHDATAGLDFKWVEFRVNKPHKDGSGEFEYWEDERQTYHPDSTMNVSELVQYLRVQKIRYDNDVANDFDDGQLKGGGVDPKGAKICVTAFVNEYYYTEDPRDGSYDRDLWKKFVNQPMREMHILSDTKQSADGESMEIGASFTIQQRSIQTIYNVNNPDLHSAWGSEFTDDPLESNSGGGDSTEYSYSGASDYNKNRGNNSMTNGRENSAREWGLYGNNRVYDLNGSGKPKPQWSTFLNLTADNTSPLLTDDHRYLRYSCMSRNRDNNGNGYIDLDEIRWYMGATNQLYGLYFGDYGIEGAAKLYQRNVVEQASTDKSVWCQHVLSSTRQTGNSDGSITTNSGPRCIWAEEGVTGSTMKASKDNPPNVVTFSTRCLRNLGYDSASTASSEKMKDFTYSPLNHEPDKYITVKKKHKSTYDDYSGSFDSNTYFEFDCSRINEQSLRYFTSIELDLTNEFAETAFLPRHFRMAAKIDHPLINPAKTIDQINSTLDQLVGQNPYCPPGFRLPNIRELVLMRYFTEEEDSNIQTYFKGNVDNATMYAFPRTYWSFGVKGSNKRDDKSWGWGCSHLKLVMAKEGKDQYTPEVRCVKDINPNDPDDIY